MNTFTPDGTPVARRALVAAMRGRLIAYRLDTPTLHALRAEILAVLHGRRADDKDGIGRTLLGELRTIDGVITRRELLDRQAHLNASELQPQCASTGPLPGSGGTRVPVPPSPPKPLPPARLREPADAL